MPFFTMTSLIWNTGNGQGQDGDPISNTFANMAQKLIPVLDAVKDDVKLPDFMPQSKEYKDYAEKAIKLMSVDTKNIKDDIKK
jgi:hypothetical protein